MGQSSVTAESLGREVFRLSFPVRVLKTSVVVVFGGLTTMVAVWAVTALSTAELWATGGSRQFFVMISILFALLITVGSGTALWLLSRVPQALVVRERGIVLEQGASTRYVSLEEIVGIDQQVERDSLSYVVLLADGSHAAFGLGQRPEAAAAAIVKQAGLLWVKEPFKARRA